MTHHAQVGRAQPQLERHLVGAALRVERKDDDAALALRKALEAARHSVEIQGGLVAGARRHQIPAETLEEPLSSSDATPEVGHDPAAGPEDEGGESVGLAHLSRAQALERHEDDVLGEVVCGRRVAEVAQAVEANPGRQPLVQLGLGPAVPVGESARQLGVARTLDAVCLCQSAASITQVLSLEGEV